MNYNLIDEKWIPVLYRDGRWERVGIRTALEDAGRIRQIAASNPMDRVAILRFLLAVLQWCKPVLTQNEREHLGDKGVKGIPSTWLGKNLGRPDLPNTVFDLFDAGGGFYQDDSIENGKLSAVTNLLHDLPSGTNIAHFRHTRDDRDGLCLSCCALGLVRWSSVAAAGTAGAGQSMTASINGNTPAYAIPSGTNLLETLLLTRPYGREIDGDAPVWAGASEQSPLGFLKGLTWRSRRILLAPPDAQGKRELAPGRCCHCGEDADRIVRAVLFRPGWPRPYKEPWLDDPHLLGIKRKQARKAKEKRLVPPWPSPNDALEDHSAVWRTVCQGLLQRLGDSQADAAEIDITLLGTSQALYKHVGALKMALPEFHTHDAKRLLAEIEWLRQVTWGTISARGGSWHDPPKGHRVVGALCAPGAKGQAIRSGLCASSPTIEHEMERAFHRLMQGLSSAGRTGSRSKEQVLQEWRDAICKALQYHVGHVVEHAITGSPLHRREAMQRADYAARRAVRSTEVLEQNAEKNDHGSAAHRSSRQTGKKGHTQ